MSTERAAAIAALLFCGCTYELEPGPRALPPAGSFVLVESTPRPARLDVSTTTSVDLRFSAAPDAWSLTGGHLRLFAGLVEMRGALQVDLLEHRVRLTPDRPLQEALRHQVYASGDLRGLNGAQLGVTVVYDFTTGMTPTSAAPPPGPPIAPLVAADVQPIWNAQCGSCHQQGQAAAGLDLSSAKAAVSGLRGRLARGAPRQLAVPFDHARSYLMLKLLDEGGITGFGMPPGGPALQRAELRRVADWIDDGARP